MGTTTQKLTLSAAFGIAGLLSASCNSTPAPAEEPVATEEATTSTTLSLPAGEAAAAETQTADEPAPTAADPYADRAAPFSKETVEALESQLKPLDNIPVPGEALPPPNDQGVVRRS